MANLYWVGGSGNWSDNTNHWSASSGGSPGASLPTSSDNVFFDGSSGSGTVTQNYNPSGFGADCLTLDASTSSIASINMSSTLNVYGSYILKSGMTLTGSSNTIFQGASTHTITTNGVSLTPIQFTASGSYTFQDNVTMGGSSLFNIFSGTINFGSNTFTLNNVSFIATGNAIVNLNSATINLASKIWTCRSGFTLNCGTSTINLSGSNSCTLITSGYTFNNITITGGGPGQLHHIQCSSNTQVTSCIINSLTIAAGSYMNFQVGGSGEDQTYNVTNLTAIGNSSNRIVIGGGVSGSVIPFLAATNLSIDYVDFWLLKESGTSAPYLGGNIRYITSNSVGAIKNEWSNPSVSGNVYRDMFSDNLYATGGFSGAIDEWGATYTMPTLTGAFVHGIEVFVEAKDSAATPTTWTMTCKLTNDLGTTFTSTKTQTWSSTSDVIASYGGPTDTWGTTWSVSDFNSGNFVSLFQITAGTSSQTFSVDSIAIQLYTSSSSGLNSYTRLVTTPKLQSIDIPTLDNLSVSNPVPYNGDVSQDPPPLAYIDDVTG